MYSREFHGHLNKHGYQQMQTDTSLFIKNTHKGIILIGISMDDFPRIASDHPHRRLVHNTPKKYSVKRIGRPTKYINWTVQCGRECIHLSQPDHINSVAARMSQQECNPKSTPYLDGTNMDPPADNEPMRAEIAETYGKAIGEIRYIADSTRPDIAFAATALARALRTPTQRGWRLAQRLVQYVA